MAKGTVATIDLSSYTEEFLLQQRAARQAQRDANGLNRQSALATNDVVIAGEEAPAVVLPAFALDPKHVIAGFSGNELVELSKLGARSFGNMPLRARAVMTVKGGRVNGAENGDIAIYTTNEKGVQCDEPVLARTDAWAGIWNTVSDFYTEHVRQYVAWAAREAAPQGGSTRYYGHAVRTNVNLIDKFGNDRNLGRHCFFFDESDFNTLVAPLIAGHTAQKEQAALFGKKVTLVTNTLDKLLLAGSVAYRMNPRIKPEILLSRLYLNMPSARWDDVRDFVLNASLPGAERVANHYALRAKIAEGNAKLQAPAAQPVIAAPAEADEYVSPTPESNDYI